MPIKNEIKILLAKKDMTMTELVNKLNKHYNRNDTLQNLSKKLNSNTLKYREAEEIAEILNCDLKFIEKDEIIMSSRKT